MYDYDCACMWMVRVDKEVHISWCIYTSGGVSLGISLRMRTHLFSGTALTLSVISSNWRWWDPNKREYQSIHVLLSIEKCSVSIIDVGSVSITVVVMLCVCVLWWCWPLIASFIRLRSVVNPLTCIYTRIHYAMHHTSVTWQSHDIHINKAEYMIMQSICTYIYIHTHTHVLTHTTQLYIDITVHVYMYLTKSCYDRHWHKMITIHLWG